MQTFVQSLRSQLTAVVCSMLLIPGGPQIAAQDPVAQQSGVPDEQAAKIPNDQLDSLVAPIALYPDPLLAQVLAASTYPLEIIQLQQWLAQHKELKDKALADAVIKQPWDPSIQSMAALPDVVKRLADDIQWTTDLGNAVLAQQSDVMDAVQRMRAKAQEKGNLKSNEEMKVETKVIENKSVVVIEQAKPDVVYVPSYDPVVVYGAPPYPYPPISYPPPGYYAAGMAISFGVGMAIGAAWGGGWCCNSGWGGNNNININNNNTFVNNSNRQNINNSGNRTGNRTGSGNNWQHNAQHRGGTPYSNKATANKYGGTARGDSASSRQANARQNQGQLGGGQQAGSMDRGGRQQSGASNRAGGSASGANRAGGGGDRVGNRSVSPNASASSKGGGGAFGGASSGRSGSATRASSSRGASSMGGSRGGSRGGGRRR
ncbi:MAG TPA: DUF3300 domain-containing protein [Candidatus Solibacter sp.]|nr:DUF3300 domain-containing protein [Candidatus Solibacter sp.]